MARGPVLTPRLDVDLRDRDRRRKVGDRTVPTGQDGDRPAHLDPAARCRCGAVYPAVEHHTRVGQLVGLICGQDGAVVGSRHVDLEGPAIPAVAVRSQGCHHERPGRIGGLGPGAHLPRFDSASFCACALGILTGVDFSACAGATTPTRTRTAITASAFIKQPPLRVGRRRA